MAICPPTWRALFLSTQWWIQGCTMPEVWTEAKQHSSDLQLWCSIYSWSCHNLSYGWLSNYSSRDPWHHSLTPYRSLQHCCHRAPTPATEWWACSANSDGACIDICARGFWNVSQDAFFDVRVFIPNAFFNRSTNPSSVYRRHEQAKKREYGQWGWARSIHSLFFLQPVA